MKRAREREGGMLTVCYTRRCHGFCQVVQGEATGAKGAGRQLRRVRRIRRKVQDASFGTGVLCLFAGRMPAFRKAVGIEANDISTVRENFLISGLFTFRPPSAHGCHARLPSVIRCECFLPVGRSFDNLSRNAHGDEGGFVQEFGIADHIKGLVAETVVALVAKAMKERFCRLTQQSLVWVVDNVVNEIAELATAFHNEVVPVRFKEACVESRFGAVALAQKRLEHRDIFGQRMATRGVVKFDEKMNVVGHENKRLDRVESGRIAQELVYGCRQGAGECVIGVDAPREARIQATERRHARQAFERDEVVIRGAVVPFGQATHGGYYTIKARATHALQDGNGGVQRTRGRTGIVVCNARAAEREWWSQRACGKTGNQPGALLLGSPARCAWLCGYKERRKR